jgi:hypothetical protein
MDDLEFERLRKTICRSFNSSPHKKKYWLALLEMRAEADELRRAAEPQTAAPPPGSAVTPAD